MILLLEVCAAFLLFWFLVTQMLLPYLRETRLFPSLRHPVERLSDELDDLTDQEVTRVLEAEVEKRRAALKDEKLHDKI